MSRTLLAASLLLATAAMTSAQSEAERELRRGIDLLHEFEYEDANEAFRRVQTLDVAAPLGYWGEAMTYHQALWRHENLEAGRAALGRLGRTPAERRAKCRTAKEAELIGAAEILFGPGDATARRRAYADAMARIHDHFSSDSDIAALYALSLLATASRGLVGMSDAHDAHTEGLAGSDLQAHVAAILNDVLKTDPHNRGALHYLLHTYDDPDHARLALPAARTYAGIAQASHARHMPSHIFLQLGLWDDAAGSDRAAFAASTAWVRERKLGAALRNYHALAWLEYELLQLGRYREAEETMRELEPVVAATKDVTLLSDLSSMRARYAVETQRWDRMSHEQTFANVNDLFAIGLSAARAGNMGAARMAQQKLEERAGAKEEGDLRPAIDVMAREVTAMIALASGRHQEAVDALESAARAELALPAPFGLPEPIKPAPELFGEVLLATGRPADAIDWFERALRRNVNRSRSIIGLARALAAAGQVDRARDRYQQALANFAHADSDVPELAELHTGVETKSPTARSWQPIALGALALTAATFVAVVIARRRARPQTKKPALTARAGRNASRKRRNQKR